MKYEVVKQINFYGLMCDVLADGKGYFYMTREQIGQALEYNNPMIAIAKIHDRHKDRFEKLSLTILVNGRETYLYSAKGIYEICRWSKQPKANKFYDNIYEMLEGLRTGYLKLVAEKQTLDWQETRHQGKLTRRSETDVIKDLVEYAKEQGSKNADKLYTVYSKLANNMAGISSREQSTISELNNLALVENIILHVIREGIILNKHYKEIYQDCKHRLVDFNRMAYLTA
jgi:prophage antirepressor-like protein